MPRLVRKIRKSLFGTSLADVLGPLKEMKANLLSLQEANRAEVKEKEQEVSDLLGEINEAKAENAQAEIAHKNLFALLNFEVKGDSDA